MVRDVPPGDDGFRRAVVSGARPIMVREYEGGLSATFQHRTYERPVTRPNAQNPLWEWQVYPSFERAVSDARRRQHAEFAELAGTSIRYAETRYPSRVTACFPDPDAAVVL